MDPEAVKLTDEILKPAGEAPAEPATTPTPPPYSAAIDIAKAVKENLVHSNVGVRTAIVDKLTKEEIDKRVKAATSVFEKLETAETELRKIRPAHVGFSSTGDPIGEPVHTREQVKQIKETKETIDKLNKALEKALVHNDFSKVFELGK